MEIVRMYFGSKLYGTSTPESDTDIKGVFFPTYSDIILQRVPRSISDNTSGKDVKNESQDIDSEFYSIHHFFKLLSEGQTVALDMLFVNEQNIISKTPMWDEIVANKELFLSKNISAFTGYCRTQATKYSIKGEKMTIIQHLLELIESLIQKTSYITLKDAWDFLPVGDYYLKYFCEKSKLNIYEIYGRKFQETCSLSYLVESLKAILESYGKRAIKAKENGVDWKAISHAFRVCFEVMELLEYGRITFPLISAEFVTSIKKGELDYYGHNIGGLLDEALEMVETAAKISKLPETVNKDEIDNFLQSLIERYIFKLDEDHKILKKEKSGEI